MGRGWAEGGGERETYERRINRLVGCLTTMRKLPLAYGLWEKVT